MAVPNKQFEPLKLAAGDTINFLKGLPDYPASQGWSLKYEARGGAQPIEFVSASIGDSHQVTVPAATTAGWLPGNYQLVGYAENAAAGEREQFYQNFLTITPNMEGADGDLPVETHAQKMIRLIEAVQEGKATHDILESDIEATRIKRLSPKDLRDEYDYWLFRRGLEVKKADANTRGVNKRNRLTRFTDPAGGTSGQFGALPPINPFG